MDERTSTFLDDLAGTLRAIPRFALGHPVPGERWSTAINMDGMMVSRSRLDRDRRDASQELFDAATRLFDEISEKALLAKHLYVYFALQLGDDRRAFAVYGARSGDELRRAMRSELAEFDEQQAQERPDEVDTKPYIRLLRDPIPGESPPDLSGVNLPDKAFTGPEPVSSPEFPPAEGIDGEPAAPRQRAAGPRELVSSPRARWRSGATLGACAVIAVALAIVSSSPVPPVREPMERVALPAAVAPAEPGVAAEAVAPAPVEPASPALPTLIVEPAIQAADSSAPAITSSAVPGGTIAPKRASWADEARSPAGPKSLESLPTAPTHDQPASARIAVPFGSTVEVQSPPMPSYRVFVDRSPKQRSPGLHVIIPLPSGSRQQIEFFDKSGRATLEIASR